MNKKLLLIVSFGLFSLGLFAQTKNGEEPKRLTGSAYAHASDLDISQDYLNKMIRAKLAILTSDFSLLIGHKGNPAPIIDNAMLLWNNNNEKLVTVTSPNKTKPPTVKPVRTYLTNMSRLPFKEVKVNYSKFSCIQGFHKRPDGLYEGIVKFEQSFEATGGPDNATLVNDRVERTITIIVAVNLVMKDGKLTGRAEIFFGDMNVTNVEA